MFDKYISGRGFKSHSGQFSIATSKYPPVVNIYIVNAMVKPPHPRSRDSQGQEKFLAPSAYKQIRNYDTEC